MNAPTSIDKTARRASYDQPDWMDDATWQQVSADLTEQWLTLLDQAARATHVQQQAQRRA